MKDKMMICKLGYNITDKTRCRICEEFRPDDDGNCVSCIPYEPEIIPITICFKCGEYFKGSDKVCIQDGKIYHTQCLHILEPQPATCPDCGHPKHEKICHVEIDTRIGHYKLCQCTPADLQPEKQCNHSWVKRNEETNLVPYLECIYCKIRKLPEQPTQMPLIEAPLTENNWHDEGFIMGRNLQRDADMAWLPIHDSAIAARARREFAEKVIETMPLVRIPVKPDMDYPITETAMFTQALNEAFATEYKEILAHIRAMAKGKE